MIKKVKKTVNQFFCDICGQEEDRFYIVKCKRCNRELCSNCYEDFDFDCIGEYGYSQECTLCLNCVKDAQIIAKQIEKRFEEFLSWKKKIVREFVEKGMIN